MIQLLCSYELIVPCGVEKDNKFVADIAQLVFGGRVPSEPAEDLFAGCVEQLLSSLKVSRCSYKRCFLAQIVARRTRPSLKVRPRRTIRSFSASSDGYLFWGDPERFVGMSFLLQICVRIFSCPSSTTVVTLVGEAGGNRHRCTHFEYAPIEFLVNSFPVSMVARRKESSRLVILGQPQQLLGVYVVIFYKKQWTPANVIAAADR